MEIELGREYDIDDWMNLVNKVKADFPGLETKDAVEAHRETVLDFMKRESAVCAKSEDRIVGALLFSKEHNMLCFLAVDAEYRRQHIAEKMVSYMLTFLDAGKDVIVTTYRDGVPEGIAARAFYQRLGFVEGKLTEEFGCPVQEFVLRKL
ncbi:MAG: GNAT family N-acetyltransferase [Faecousia sp.]